LPPRYAEVFLGGCADALTHMAPIRMTGEAVRNDGLVEQYRAGFIPIAVKPRALTWLAFGAFNSRVVAPAIAG
jgi:hypothetical protein